MIYFYNIFSELASILELLPLLQLICAGLTIGYISMGWLGQTLNSAALINGSNSVRLLFAVSFFSIMALLYASHTVSSASNAVNQHTFEMYGPVWHVVVCLIILHTTAFVLYISCAEMCLFHTLMAVGVLGDQLFQLGIMNSMSDSALTNYLGCFLYTNLVYMALYMGRHYLGLLGTVHYNRPGHEHSKDTSKNSTEHNNNDDRKASNHSLPEAFIIRLYVQFPLTLMNVFQLLLVSGEQTTGALWSVTLGAQCCVLGSLVVCTIYYWKDLMAFEVPYRGICMLLLPYHGYNVICGIVHQTKQGVTPQFTRFAIVAVLFYGIGAVPAALAAGTIVPYEHVTPTINIGGASTQLTPDTSSHGDGHAIGEGAGSAGGRGVGGRGGGAWLAYLQGQWTGFVMDWTTNFPRTVGNQGVSAALTSGCVWTWNCCAEMVTNCCTITWPNATTGVTPSDAQDAMEAQPIPSETPGVHRRSGQGYTMLTFARNIAIRVSEVSGQQGQQ